MHREEGIYDKRMIKNKGILYLVKTELWSIKSKYFS